MKKFILITVSIVLFLILGIFIITFPFSAISIYPLLFAEKPPEPTIKYSEFPFQLEYEINGKKFNIKDTLICEFGGFKLSETGEKRRCWKSYLKNNDVEWYTEQWYTRDTFAEEVEIVLLKIDEKTRISFLLGSASYYMNDSTYINGMTNDEAEKLQEFYRFPDANYSINKFNVEKDKEILYRPVDYSQ